jgi:hypothetical protein
MQKWPVEPKLEKRRLVGRLGFAHLAVRQHFSPVKSRDFPAKVCSPRIAIRKDRREGGVEPPQPDL